MSAKDDVEEFLECVPEERRPVLNRARELIRDAYPQATESIKWNQLVYEIDGSNRFYIAYFTDHVNLGFMQGSDLDDPESILEGTGKNMRHVKLRDPTELENPGVRSLVENAL